MYIPQHVYTFVKTMSSESMMSFLKMYCGSKMLGLYQTHDVP